MVLVSSFRIGFSFPEFVFNLTCFSLYIFESRSSRGLQNERDYYTLQGGR